MEALVSGRAGRAVVVEDGALYSIESRVPGVLVPRRASDLPYLLGESRDVIALSGVQLEEVLSELDQESEFTAALDLALIALDSELPPEDRREAIEVLGEMCEDSAILERLEGVLYGRPLPESADIIGALDCCELGHSTLVHSMYERLAERQRSIRIVHDAWTAIPMSVFGGQEHFASFQRVAVRQGLFRSLVLMHAENGNFGSFFISASRNGFVHELHNYREVLLEWGGPFRLRVAQASVHSKEEGEHDTGRKGRKKRRGGRFDRSLALANVESQKQLIKDLMGRSDLLRAQELVSELVNYQIGNDGGGEFAVMSLCDLAMEAKYLGLYSLALELTTKSVELVPDDAWSWTHHAGALFNMGRFEKALDAYAQADGFGAGVVAKSGRAEVLKALGRFDESLGAYDAVIAGYAEDVVARNGRAEVLKALGRLDESLEAYDAVVEAHPEDVVAKSGRAEVLKALGRFDESLEAYDSVIDVHREEVYPRNGRAGVLKAMGRFDESLESYLAVIEAHPENVVAKTGRAEVLKAMGRLDESLEAYDAVIEAHPEDAYSNNGRAEVLKVLGRLEESLEAYDVVIAGHPENVVAKTGRAEVLKALGQLDESLYSYDAVIAGHPESVVAKDGRAEVLKAMGRLEESLEAYDAVIAAHPRDVYAKNGRAAVLKEMGRLDESLEAYESVIAGHPENVSAKNGRAEVLKAMGQLEESLDSYDAIIAWHPENVYAKNGRAEVLKAIGRLEESLEAYDAVIAGHPENVVAKSGRSCILAALHRDSEALECLEFLGEPVTLHDWIAYHIRGMILLRAGDVHGAVSIFDRGAAASPWYATKEYFRTSLAAAYIRLRDFDKAANALEGVRAPAVQPIANVLRLHVFGIRGDQPRASAAYRDLTGEIGSVARELKDELSRRYIFGTGPQHDDAWIDDREVECLLLAA